MIGARGMFGETMDNKERAFKLIKKADWETIRQMVGFLFDKQYLRDLIYSKIDMIAHCIEHKVYDKAEKELIDFIEFFDNPKTELNKKYNEIFKKDIESIKKKDYIEIDELLKTDRKLDAMMEAKEQKEEDYLEMDEDREMKADLKRKYEDS